MRRSLLGLGIDPVDYGAAVAFVADHISRIDRSVARIVQANVYSLVQAIEDSEYRRAVSDADLLVPDGMPLVWLLRAEGEPIKKRVYGPDLMCKLAKEAAQRGWRCFLYGGRPGVPELLRERLVGDFPGLQIVGTFSPPFRRLSPEEDAEICELINKIRPDILWIGLGTPKQDLWMYEHCGILEVAVMHGVGAAFDFLSGRVPQSPRWMMNAGLEWLFRLFQEPRRLWKRYTIVNMKFVYYLLAWWLTKRL